MSSEHPDQSFGPLGRPLDRPNPPLGASLFNDPVRKPVGALSVFAIVGIALAVGAAIYDAILAWRMIGIVDRFIAGTATRSELRDMIDYVDRLNWPLLLVLLIPGIAFLWWLRRARVNAELLAGPESQGHDRGWVIGSWFVPVVNFWYPFQVVRDIWRASTPQDDRSALLGRPSEGLLVGWWVMWVLAWVMNFVLRVQSRTEYTTANIQSQLRILGTVDTLHAVFTALAGILVVLVIRRITAWQDAPTGE